MTSPTPVLGAKLLPPHPGPLHLRRARLHDRLARSLEGRVTAVIAGPGYGKTSLLARFLPEIGGDIVWYSLDPSDREPWSFFRYLIHGFREHAPEFGERIGWIWRDPRSRSDKAENLADVFMGEAEESLAGRYIVVLDQVHHLEGSATGLRALNRLLAYLPGTLHVVLAGRSAPDVGLKGLLAEGQATVIQGSELLFTREETKALLVDTFGLPLTGGALDGVHTRTRGWVTALQLLRQSAALQDSSPDLPEELSARTETEIFDYFTEKVLAAEPDDVRAFLLGSCPPLVFDPDLLAEVLDDLDVRPILQGLLRRNLFISPLESRSVQYAYDPLFHDYLRRKLRSDRDAGSRRALDRRYARAFARRGEQSQALSHAIAAEDTRFTSLLLAKHGKSLLRGGLLDLVREASSLLTGHGVRSAVVDDLLGEASRLSGDFAAAIAHFERALQPAAGGGAGLPAGARASTLQGLAYALLKVGEPSRAAETAERALAEAGDSDPSLTARILNTLSLVHYRANRHEAALSGWHEALARARQAGDEHLILMIAHNLGLPHAARGDFRRASECFRILTAPENTRVGPEEGAACLNLARIAILRGEFQEASAFLGDAREIAQKFRLQALAADVLEAEGTLLRETGDHAASHERYARARALFTELGRPDLLAGLSEEEAILAAYSGRDDEARSILLPIVERGRTLLDGEALASALLALGEIEARAGRDESATAALGEATAIFSTLDRAYQRCRAHAWLALVLHRRGARDDAARAAEEALAIATRFDYLPAIRRIAGTDPDFHRWLAARDGAPQGLRHAAAGAPGPVPSGTPDLTVRLLGPVEVYRDREHLIPPRAWTIKRALTIFCYLAASRDRRASKERIIDALWGDTRLTVIEKNFHPTISFLRRALNHGHKVPRHFILYESGAYRLNPAYRYAIDTEEFESGLREARRLAQSGDEAGALALYDAALALYRGPFLEEEYDEWAEAPRSRLEALHRAALRDAGRLHIESGSAATGVALLAHAVALDPIDEDASAELMLGHGRCGHRAEVEKEFERLRKELADEQSGPPSPAAHQARERALRLAAGEQHAPDAAAAVEGRKVVPMRRVRKGEAPRRGDT